MAKRLIDVDEDALRAAQAELGTDTIKDTVNEALRVQRLLADRGLRGGKVPDLLIAAAAESRSMTLVHYDADFGHITAVTGQPTTWVVPEGSID